MENRIVINNQLISYLHNETVGKMCLLFLHGWRSNKEVWNEIANQLISLSAYQLYTIDLPGFGNSPNPSFEKRGGWTVSDYAEVVKGFMEKLELKNVILIGHSFGGRVGIKLAASQPRNYAEPNAESRGKSQSTIQKLVLVDSAGFAMQSSKKSLMHTAAKIVRPFFKPKFMQPLRKKIYEIIGAEDYLATPELQETFKNIIGEDLTEDMKRIKIPTLIVWGEKDEETPIEFLYKMQSLIPNTKYQILKNAGHFSFLDKPEEFVEVLKEFIDTDQLIVHG